MPKKLKLLPLLFCLTSASAAAQSHGAGEMYLDVMPLLVRADRDRGVDNPGVGLRTSLGYGLGDGWYLEGQLFGVRMELEEPLDFRNAYTSGLGLDAVYAFSDRWQYTPFVLAGVGVSNNNPPFRSSSTDGFFNLGGGLVTKPLGRSNVRLRAELRYLRDYFSNNMNDWHFGVGISIPLTPPPAPPAPAVVATPPPPPKAEPKPAPKPKPQEPTRTLVLENVHFEFNSANLTAAARSSLDQTARELNSAPKGRIEVAGHTDSRGAAAYNMRLSEQRANAVRQYLVDKGVPAARISARGYGAEQPVASNATDAGRAQNRRVELRFYD